jgi:2-haloacid dehalogenase
LGSNENGTELLPKQCPEPFDLGRERSGIFNLFAALNVMRRRRFLEIVVASTISVGASAAEASIEKKAIAFDGFVIFDPKSVAVLAENLFPGKGPDLMNAWGLRQFEYSWLRNSMGRYADFWTITSQALHFAARLTKLDLSKEKHDQLMNGFLEMKAYPDVQPALQTLSDAGLRLGFLSNLTEAMIEANIKSAGLQGRFELLLSTDRVQAYKPDPRAYQMGIDAFGLPKEQILFAAFRGWDAAGAKSFGYDTYWANRLNLPVEELDVLPDSVGAGMKELMRLVTGS